MEIASYIIGVRNDNQYQFWFAFFSRLYVKWSLNIDGFGIQTIWSRWTGKIERTTVMTCIPNVKLGAY